MVQLRLDGIDFSKYLIAYRQPVLDAMEWMVANATQAAQFKFVDARGLVRRMTAFTSPADVSFYLGKILDFIKKCDSPLTVGEFLELIRVDQAARMTVGWKKLQDVRPKTRSPGDMVACRNFLRLVFSFEAFAAGVKLVWNPSSTTLGCVRALPTEKWGAVEFLKEVFRVNKLSYCPYCNADMVYAVDAIEDSEKHLRTDIDHFFPRFKYPYLALSPNNLVPSCARCNQRLKRDIDVVNHDRLRKRRKAYRDNLDGLKLPRLIYSNPYLDDFNSHVLFAYQDIVPALFEGSASSDMLRLKCDASATDVGDRCGESVVLYRLRTVYERIFERELRELPMRLRLAKTCYATMLSEAIERWHGTGVDEDSKAWFLMHLQDVLTKELVEPGRINDERLGKLRSDIAFQLGI